MKLYSDHFTLVVTVKTAGLQATPPSFTHCPYKKDRAVPLEAVLLLL